MNANPPPQTRFSFRRQPPRRATARRCRPGGPRRFGAASNVVLLTRSATTNCVLKETFDLTWKAVVSNETEIVTNTLGKTDGHVFYTIFGEPEPPWVNNTITNQNAWASALEIVCSNGWANGTSSFSEATETITRAIFDSNHFQYETNHGRTMFLDKDGHFTLTSFLGSLKRPGKADLNCSDDTLKHKWL